MSRRGYGQQQPKPAIADQDRKFMEDAIRSLPRAPQPGGESAFADRLLNYGYHTNPYVRTFTSVLWSGYALSRGQVVDSDARFRKAKEDATVSNVDRTTIAALDSAHSALQHSLAPSGSVATFLDELRERTIQRMWARVCETSNLPPPSFTSLLKQSDVDAPTSEELDAAEAAEIAAMMKNPPAEITDVLDAAQEDVSVGDDAASVGEESTAAADDDDGSYSADADRESPSSDEGQSGEQQAGEPQSGEPQPAQLQISVRRSGGAELGAELVLQAAAEAVKQLRVQGGTGAIEVTLTVTGAGQQRASKNSGSGGGGGGGRRRRGRRR